MATTTGTDTFSSRAVHGTAILVVADGQDVFTDKVTTAEKVTPGGGTVIQVLNRVYDSVAGNFVRWVTDSPDTAGASYPGPGTFGPDTSDYIVEDQTFA